jgi:hypothetical protein
MAEYHKRTQGVKMPHSVHDFEPSAGCGLSAMGSVPTLDGEIVRRRVGKDWEVVRFSGFQVIK